MSEAKSFAFAVIRTLLLSLLVGTIFSPRPSVAADGSSPPLAVADLARHPDLTSTWEADGRTFIKLTIHNASPAEASIAVPAGLICALGTSGDRMLALRTVTIKIAPNGTAEATIPAVALSTTVALGNRACRPTPDREPRVAPFLTWLATQPDLPRTTAQLIVFSLLADITFPQWQTFLTTPPDVVTAIDALGILRILDPARTPALATDSGLKVRALRDPVCRAKAGLLYGLALPAEIPSGPIPDIGALLHRTPGDNCPICRERAKMQRGASDL